MATPPDRTARAQVKERVAAAKAAAKPSGGMDFAAGFKKQDEANRKAREMEKVPLPQHQS